MCNSILTDLEVAHQIDAFPHTATLSEALLAESHFDLLYLDILMDGENGMELARRLRTADDRTRILFITVSSEFLKDGYEVRPLQYLLKPLQPQELKEALQTDLCLHHKPQSLALTLGAKKPCAASG